MLLSLNYNYTFYLENTYPSIFLLFGVQIYLT